MKKLFAYLCAFALLAALLAGCTPVADDADGTSQRENVLHAWTGEFSEEKLTQAIQKYQNECAAVVVNEENTAVSFETDFEVSSHTVVRLSQVDATDIHIELNGYIDLKIESHCDGKIITVSTDWWNEGESSWTKDCTLWSYLVCAKDAGGSEQYYYFRADYSALVKVGETTLPTTTVTTQSAAAPTTDTTADRTYPSRYTGRNDTKICVTAVTQDACLPFTVVAGDRSNYRIGRLPSIDADNGKAEAVIIRSVDEWEAIAAENRPESAPAYDAAFFERGVLVLLVSHCSYGNFQLRITNAAVSGDTLMLEMGYIMPGGRTPMMTDWLVLIELKKEDVEGVDTLRADYWESRWAYPDEDT